MRSVTVGVELGDGGIPVGPTAEHAGHDRRVLDRLLRAAERARAESPDGCAVRQDTPPAPETALTCLRVDGRARCPQSARRRTPRSHSHPDVARRRCRTARRRTCVLTNATQSMKWYFPAPGAAASSTRVVARFVRSRVVERHVGRADPDDRVLFEAVELRACVDAPLEVDARNPPSISTSPSDGSISTASKRSWQSACERCACAGALAARTTAASSALTGNRLCMFEYLEFDEPVSVCVG